jgi:hypothetical protein
MKNKRVLLGLMAFTIAIGTALAIQGSPRPAYISVRLWGNENFLCVNTGLQCSDFGPVTCKVDVSTIFGAITVTGKRDAGCVTTLNSNSNASVGIYIPIVGIILSAQ